MMMAAGIRCVDCDLATGTGLGFLAGSGIAVFAMLPTLPPVLRFAAARQQDE